MAAHIEIVPVDHELAVRMVRAAGVPFSFDMDDADELEEVVAAFEPERSYVPMDGGDVVGSGSSNLYTATVPGGARLATAGVTFITVLPTHRRRGVLRKMMRTLLDDAVARGEPLSALWASEATIYGRFGFGQAVNHVTWTLDSRKASWRTERPPGRARLISAEEAAEIIPPLHGAACERHGMLGRSPHLWATYSLYDGSWMRRGFSARRIVVWEGESGLEGYGFFRTRLGDDPAVRVDEFHGISGGAYRGLAEFFAGVDLTDKVIFQRRPTDEPVQWMLGDSRALAPTSAEYMWYRLLDLPEALGARSYTGSGEVVMEVHDPFFDSNDGRWRLTVDGGKATCVSTDALGEVTLDVSDLGALYMGGRSALTLADAGRIHGSPGAIGRLDRLFRTARPPWSGEEF